MKTIVTALVLFSTLAIAAPKNRKVSNSSYFLCSLEREASDKKAFKKDYSFPFPMVDGESYELKGSMRWNDYNLNFKHDGSVEIVVSEKVNGKRITAKKEYDLGKEEPFTKSMNVQLELKNNDVVVNYQISCRPE